MTWDWLKPLELLKLPARYFVGAVLVSGILMFSSDSMARRLGIYDFRVKFSLYLGLSFIIALVLVIVNVGTKIFDLGKNKYNEASFRKISEKRLLNLTPEEKRILCGYILRETRTQYFGLEDGVVRGLEHAKIIYRASSVGHVIEGFSFNLQDWAWDYLKEHTELITEGVPKDEKGRVILKGKSIQGL